LPERKVAISFKIIGKSQQKFSLPWQVFIPKRTTVSFTWSFINIFS